MIVQFVTNDIWYSRLTRWIFGEKPTHVGLSFDDEGVSIVMDISKPCGSLCSLKYWLSNKYYLVSSYPVNLSPEDERDAILKVQFFCVLREYAWGAYYFGLFTGLFHKLFGTPLPKTNPLENFDKGLCTNIFDPIKSILLKYGIDMTNDDMYAKTPGMVEHYFNVLYGARK